MNKNNKNNLLIKIVVSLFLIGYLFYKTDRAQFVKNISKFDLTFIPFIVILILLNYIVSSYRWKSLLVGKESEKITVGYLTTLYFVGSFFNNFMPTSIGGDVYKIFKLGKKTGNNYHSFSATFMERFTGVLLLLIISLVGLTTILRFWIIPILFWIIIAAYFMFKVFKMLALKYSKVNEIYKSFAQYKGKYKVLAIALFTSLVVQLFSILSQYLIYFSLGIHLPIAYALFVFPIITLVGFFIPSLNGVGVQDALFVSMFSLIGVSTSISLSASILYHLFRLGVSLVGGVLYALGKAD